jgi:hypothetical protein
VFSHVLHFVIIAEDQTGSVQSLRYIRAAQPSYRQLGGSGSFGDTGNGYGPGSAKDSGDLSAYVYGLAPNYPYVVFAKVCMCAPRSVLGMWRDMYCVLMNATRSGRIGERRHSAARYDRSRD